MTILRASLILPCRGLDDFPTHLAGESAAELLAAWTALWHPSLIAATERLPGWHPADEPPDPATLEGELVLVPLVSRQRMASDWCDRLRATAPQNPPPVEVVASRQETIATMLNAASLDPNQVAANSVAEFLALGFAHLQVELLTRAMRYSTVLDSQQFESAVVAAAHAAIGGNQTAQHEELGRAFDLLADARNHVYSVDFYVVDVTLVADSIVGETLRAKLKSESATNLLISGEQIEQLAHDHPETLAELKRAIEADTVSIVGGMYHGGSHEHQSPEAILAELNMGQEAARRHLDREYEVFGQFDAALSPLLPQILKGLGFRGALHAAFDGGHLPRAEQRKTNWGSSEGATIEALSATPLNVALPETWLKLAERFGDSIAHDHVATILLAGWPGSESEYFDDLRRAARFGPVLGKLVTFDEYFRVTHAPDDWTKFYPREYPNRPGTENGENAISSQVDAYRGDVQATHQQLGVGLAAAIGLGPTDAVGDQTGRMVAINPWNFVQSQFVGTDPLDVDHSPSHNRGNKGGMLLSHVLGCGYATIASAAPLSSVALAEGMTLRNERLELTVSERTGGIQSLRTHRDRSTRVSQRLVFHHQNDASSLESQMVADRLEITRNDALIGEIASSGRILTAGGELLARFTQRVRAARGISPMIVSIDLEPQRLPEGDIWKSYFASRLAWVDDALAIRRGDRWVGRETTRERIESPEWVEIDDAIGRVTCFARGLPFHRRAAPMWLDTLLLVAGEERRRFQFAVGLDDTYPTHAALGLLTAGKPYIAEMPAQPSSPRGWFLHVAAKNTLLTHIEALLPPVKGIRVRLLETEGRETRTSLAAFRPFQAARIADFRGNLIEVLSVVDGRVEIDIGPHRFLQIEAEW